MTNKPSLFIVIGKAAFIASVLCFLLALGVKGATSRGEQEIVGVAMAFLPSAIAAWWMFRQLRVNYSQREAKAAAIAFGVFTPVSLLIGLVLGELTGGFTETYLGNRFAFPGMFVGVLLIIVLVTFVPSTLALWIARRTKRTEQAGSP